MRRERPRSAPVSSPAGKSISIVDSRVIGMGCPSPSLPLPGFAHQDYTSPLTPDYSPPLLDNRRSPPSMDHRSYLQIPRESTREPLTGGPTRAMMCIITMCSVCSWCYARSGLRYASCFPAVLHVTTPLVHKHRHCDPLTYFAHAFSRSTGCSWTRACRSFVGA